MFNDDNTAFVNSEVSKMAKTLNKTKAIYGEDTVEYQIKKVATLIENEKLLAKTKQTIESLTDEQVLELLKEKWITPIISSLNELPNEIVKELVSKISNLANKYSLTLVELESQIKKSENSLSTLIDELEGNEYDMKGLEELKTLLKGE